MDEGALERMPSIWRSLIGLLRPRQWVKNGFVLVGVIFGHGWRQPELLVEALVALVAFCLAASAIYALNDVVDADHDRQHPRKRHRPVASGAIGARAAVSIAVALVITAFALSLLADPSLIILLIIYVGMNVLYAFKVKHVVILDVYVIAAGFMLRLLAGTYGIGLPPSNWMLLCGLMLTLFLGFAKRQAELAQATPGDVGRTRRVLDNYSIGLLDKLIGVAAAGTIITYSLYTVDTHTVHLHHTDRLVFTVPIVMYGVFRYLYLLQEKRVGEDPAADLQDPHLVGAVIVWALLAVYLLA